MQASSMASLGTRTHVFQSPPFRRRNTSAGVASVSAPLCSHRRQQGCSSSPHATTRVGFSSSLNGLSLPSPPLVSSSSRSTPHSKRHFQVRASEEASMMPGAFPPMQTKPAWFWRIPAVIPYLMPVSELWMYCETAHSLHPFFAIYERIVQPILVGMSYLPGWFGIAYFLTAYLGIVRNKRWPHFLRFHVLTAMLLEIILQVAGTLNDWVPPSVYWGKIGAHFWLAIGLAYVFIVIECMWCAVSGTYADVPFISDATYLQLTFEG